MLHLRRAVVAVDGQRRVSAQSSGNSLGYFDARPHGDKIDVLRRTAYHKVTHETAHDIALASHAVGDFAYFSEYSAVK